MFPPISVHPLTVEEIDSTAESFKQDLQREANRCVRRHDVQSALAALVSIEKVEAFVYTLKMVAGSRMGMPSRARPIKLPPKRVPVRAQAKGVA